MFTGIIEEVGNVAAAGSRMRIQCRLVLEDVKEGASIAVNGVCLTAVDIQPDGFWCDLSPETLARTNLGALARRLARESGACRRRGRPAERPHRPRARRWHGRVPRSGPAARRQLVAESPDAGRSGPLRDPQRIHHAGRRQPDRGFARSAMIVGVAIIPHTYDNTVMRGYGPGTRDQCRGGPDRQICGKANDSDDRIRYPNVSAERLINRRRPS